MKRKAPKDLPSGDEEHPGSRTSSDSGFFWKNVSRLLLLLTCAGLLFGEPACHSGWALDDQETIAENPLVRGQRPAWQAFTQDYWHHRGDAGLYRPLVTLSLRLNWKWLGPGASGFHGVNVLLHLAVIAWIAFVLLLLRPRHKLPWIALVAFALHPIQSEAVVWIAGRSSSLCALAGLMPLGLCLAHKSHSKSVAFTWAFVGTLLPLLAKEDGLAFAALWWCLPLGSPKARRCGSVLALLAVGILRWRALGDLALPMGHGALASLDLVQRLPLGLGVLGKGLAGLFWPPLGLQSFEGLGWHWQTLGALLALLLLGGLLRAWRSALHSGPMASLQKAGWLALCVALLPWLQWVPNPELFGPRFLYLPLLFVSFVQPAKGQTPGWSLGRFVLGLVLLTALLRPSVADQSAGFESPQAFWTQRTLQRPNDARSWNGLANALLATDRDRPQASVLARKHWLHAIALDGNYSRPHVGLALLARQDRDAEGERQHLLAALRLAPENPVAWANLGALYLRERDSLAALDAYQKATDLQPGRAALWRGLARAHAQLKQWRQAQQAIQKASALDPGDARTQLWLQRIKR